MLTPFDALIDAIISCSGYRIPDSLVYKSRNPGGLLDYRVLVGETRQERDLNPRPLRVFKSDIDGLQALKFDVKLKITGGSARKCKTLAELALAYDKKPTQATAWAAFIKRAIGDPTIGPKTPLTFFTEQK